VTKMFGFGFGLLYCVSAVFIFILLLLWAASYLLSLLSLILQLVTGRHLDY